MKKLIAIGVILLFIGTTIIPSNGQTIDKLSLPMSRDNTLYVGGSGPDNYTSIQGAINDASDGDIVFVYDDSAPYREILTIEHSITLIGENRNSTIIDGTGRNPMVIMIFAEHVTVQNFTVVDRDPAVGVEVKADNTTVSDLWIRNIQHGIIIEARNTNSLVKNCLIQRCVIEGANIGLYTDHAWNVTISHNLLRNHDSALALFQSFQCTISCNLIIDAYPALASLFGAKNLFTRNTITACEEGVFLEASNDQVINNNFLNVTKPAYFYELPWFAFMYKSEAQLYSEYEFNRIFMKEYRVLGHSQWSGNYWNEPRTTPYIIPGWRGNFIIDLAYFHHLPPTRLAFDFHPAQQPYDNPLVPS